MQATTAPGSSAGEFVDKTDLAPGTKWTATDANAWQAELLEIITEAGLTPSGGDLTQVRQAIQLLAKLVKVDNAEAADVATKHNTLLNKVIEIGDWNMDSTASVNIAHGISNHTKIRNITVIIISDLGAIENLSSCDAGTGVSDGWWVNTGASTVALIRRSGGNFDNVFHDATSFNRGFVTIWYVE